MGGRKAKLKASSKLVTDQQAKHYRVLIAHNHYREHGGEDSVVDAEVALLQEHGHVVQVYSRHNDEVNSTGAGQVARDTIWSARTVRELARLFDTVRFDVIHVHNTFPLVSPSIYWAAARAGVPIIQTLHNFRILCPQGMFLRDGQVCEDCSGHVPWRGVAYRCYHGSAAQSSVLATMLTVHRAIGTWQRKVTRYIALNEFCRRKFIEGGLPAGKIAVKANFVDLGEQPSRAPHAATGERQGGLFVGRLSPEKGIAVLLAALEKRRDTTMDFIGDGPELARVQSLPLARALGAKSHAEVVLKMQAAAYLVMPSIWYENFPRTLVEAFACGLPVIASRLGAMAELVEDGRTGMLFAPGDASDLAEKIGWAVANPDAMRGMGEAARAEYEAKYTPAQNYRQLIAIYDDAIATGDDHGS